MQAQERSLQRDAVACGRAQVEAGDLADPDVLGEVARTGLPPVPHHLSAPGQAVQPLVAIGADQEALGRQEGQELAERRLIVGLGGEDVHMVVDQRADQQVARVVEHELRAQVAAADDVLVPFQQHLRIGAPVAGVRQVQGDGADEIARVPPSLSQEAGAHRRQGGFAEAAGDDDGLTALGVAAEEGREALQIHAPADQFGELGVAVQVQLGAGPGDGDVDPCGHQRRVEAHVVVDGLAVQVGADRREHALVGAADPMAFRRQHGGQGAHARAGDPEEVEVHAKVDSRGQPRHLL